MNFKSISTWVLTVLGIIIGIYCFKWLNSQYKIPVVGTMIEGV